MLGNISTKQAVDPLVVAAAAKYALDPNLVRAVIQTESGWNIYAKRYEPKLNESSIGLMQLLLSTARSVLGQPDLTEEQLANPATNIEAGTKYLSMLRSRYPNPDDMIASYNAGRPILASTGVYINQGYVDKVTTYWTLYAKAGGAADYAVAAYSVVAGGPEAGGDEAPPSLLLIGAAILALDIFNAFGGVKRRR